MAEPAPQDGQGAILAKQDKWIGQGFERLNSAVLATGILDTMQGLFVQRNALERYFVFDGIAISTGFPLPVRTRYIVPAFTEEKVTTSPPYPGVAIFETLGIGVGDVGLRTVSIQLGLSLQEVSVLGTRFQAAKQQTQQWGQPTWWTSSRPAYDVRGETDLDFEDAPFWDALPQDEGIVIATFETERIGDVSPRNEWEQHQETVQQGIRNLGEMIDRALRGK